MAVSPITWRIPVLNTIANSSTSNTFVGQQT
jgi:hypothetical protein